MIGLMKYIWYYISRYLQAYFWHKNISCSLYWCTPRDQRWRRSTLSSLILAPNSDTVVSRPLSIKPPSWDNSRRIVYVRKKRVPSVYQPPRRRSKIVLLSTIYEKKKNIDFSRILQIGCICIYSFAFSPVYLYPLKRQICTPIL